MALAGVGGRVMILAPITVQNLLMTYPVEAQVAAQFPLLAPTQAGDQIQLTLGGVDFVSQHLSGYAIDADGLHDDALFTITMVTGCLLSGRGGPGGRGGDGDEFGGTVGQNGFLGGTALRMGCKTHIAGTGDVSLGYGGGGGGGGSYNPGPQIGTGGSGGGGGVPLGDAGSFGIGSDANGNVGTAATISAKGVGGAAVIFGAAGGDGGELGTAPTNGEVGDTGGGVAGGAGDAIDTQGFTLTSAAGITITGDVI